MPEVFRFITARPPRPSTGTLLPVVIEDNSSELQAELHAATEEERPLDAVKGVARKFLDKQNYVSKVADLATPFKGFAAELETRWPVDPDILAEVILQVFDGDAASIVGSQSYREDRRNVGDSLIALSVLGADNTAHYKNLMIALRLCGLLERSARNDPALGRTRGIGRALKATIVLPKGIFPLPPVLNPSFVRRERQERIERDARQKQEKRESLRERYTKLKAASDELKLLPSSSFRKQPPAEEPQVTEFVAQAGEAKDLASEEGPPTMMGSQITSTQPMNPWILSENAIAQLSQSTKEVAQTLKLPLETTSLPRLRVRVEQALGEAFRELANEAKQRKKQ